MALEDPCNFSQKIIIREWTNIPLEYEVRRILGDSDVIQFRGFVHSKKLNAVSQYYHYVYFEHIARDKDKISRLLQEFYEQIKDRIPLSNFVLDFALDPTTNRVMVIEINVSSSVICSLFLTAL